MKQNILLDLNWALGNMRFWDALNGRGWFNNATKFGHADFLCDVCSDIVDVSIKNDVNFAGGSAIMPVCRNYRTIYRSNLLFSCCFFPFGGMKPAI